MPFAAHRFAKDVYDTTGLILLEKPLFYIVTLVFLHLLFDVGGIVGDVFFFLWDLFDDFSFIFFIVTGLGG